MWKTQRKKRSPLNKYAKYSSLTIQMIIIVFIGNFTGEFLDTKLHIEKSYFTIVLSLLSIIISLYYLFKKIKNE